MNTSHPNPQRGPDATRSEHKSRTEAQTAVTAGEFFTVVLLSVLPTSLNDALQISINTQTSLPIALETALDGNPVDAIAAPTYRRIVNDARFAAFFKTILTTENVLAAKSIRNAAFKSNVLSGWTQPPHPAGTDVGSLQQFLSPFIEKFNPQSSL
jgi:hypothetical protein